MGKNSKSFYKEYPNRKDHRKYKPGDSKAVDPSCRNHGTCPCVKHKATKYEKLGKLKEEETKEEIEE